eukprot:TRINITY_DN63876_c0_g1_i1.p1 TRINITY_DN63876_c0_g1~~TRINITY_DN63876_c0_g1_i1.p1  ORF type:complete len:238 (+),score=23.03 TRINITY_DN63876_c0_g1_i1:111-824(+)
MSVRPRLGASLFGASRPCLVYFRQFDKLRRSYEQTYLRNEGFSKSIAYKHLQTIEAPWKRSNMSNIRVRQLREFFYPGIALDHVRYNDQYFPDHQFVLCVDSVIEPTTVVRFLCPPYLSSPEIIAYLERFYGLNIDRVSTRTYQPMPCRVPLMGSTTKDRLYFFKSCKTVTEATVYLKETVCISTHTMYDRKTPPWDLYKEHPHHPGEQPWPELETAGYGSKGGVTKRTRQVPPAMK